jgi:hypothetical protein
MATTPDKSWQPPLQESTGPEKMGYLNDIVNATEGIVTKQPGFREMDSAIAMISGRYDRRPVESRSKLVIPRDKRALREVVANIADVRTVDGYTTENKSQTENCVLFNKLWRAIWFEAKFPQTMRRAVQWFTVGGVSYISPVYRNLRLSARNKRGMAFDAYPTSDCLPFQLPMDNNVQGAYAWTLIKFMPTFEAHAKFPTAQHLLKPIARRRYSGNAAKDRLALAERFRQDNLGISQTGGNWAEEFCEIRCTYITDLRVNDLGVPKPMGTPGSLESYVVPYLGQEIPTGDFNRGIPIKRKADIEDCYLYPNKRLMISSRGMQRPLYDGPAYSWHGMFPIARFSADEWPWEPGYSLAKDIYSVGEAQQNFERGMDQTAKQRFDPALMYDKSAMNRKTAEQFDPYEERGRLGLEGGISEATVKTALPVELLNLPAWAFTYTEYLDKGRQYLLGTDQMANLAEAKMASAQGDVMQEALEDAGPIVKDISHGMESPMQDLMEMVLSDVLQYYPTGRVMNYVGADGITPMVFDLNPESLIPSHNANGNDVTGVFTRMQRCQMFLDNFKATITPGSLHGIVQTSQKLLLMQLQRSGFMISSETVAKAFDIPNYGTSNGSTEQEKWFWEQEKKLEYAARLAQTQASLTMQPPGLAPPQVSPLANGHAQPGRPPSGNKPPELKTKGSAEGPRAVVSESG